MTGFARQEGAADGVTWTWEVKSVNGRGLDIRCRVPQGYEAFDTTARALAPKYCTRGSLQLTLSVNAVDQPSKFQINREFLEQLIELARQLEADSGIAPPRIDGLLAIRGVIETVEEAASPAERAAREDAIRQSLESALGDLVTARRGEGERLVTLIADHLSSIATLVGSARELAAVQPEALRDRLRTKLDELLEATPALAEERLAQEVAILVSKADVREELDRLDAHVGAAGDLLGEGGGIGRRLDFLCQEFNREANTLCAKSPDVELTRVGLDLKSAIERLREQVQNLE